MRTVPAETTESVIVIRIVIELLGGGRVRRRWFSLGLFFSWFLLSFGGVSLGSIRSISLLFLFFVSIFAPFVLAGAIISSLFLFFFLCSGWLLFVLLCRRRLIPSLAIKWQAINLNIIVLACNHLIFGVHLIVVEHVEVAGLARKVHRQFII